MIVAQPGKEGGWADFLKRKLGLVARPVSRLKHARALEESEKRYRLLAEHASDVIWTLGTNLRFTYISPSVERLLGYTPEQLQKITPVDILSPISARVARKVFSDEMQQELRSTRPFYSRILKLQHIRKDGTQLWAESKVSILRDEQDHIVGLLGVTRDLTERKEQDRVLRDSEYKYHLTLDALPEGVCVVDSELRLILSNSALRAWLKACGLNPQIEGEELLEVFFFWPPGIKEEYRRVFNEGAVRIVEERFTINSQDFVVEIRMIPIFEGGQVIRVISVIKDQTEMFSTKEELTAAQANYKELIENANSIILRVDSGGRVVFFNEYAKQLFGSSPEQITARDFLQGTIASAQGHSDMAMLIESASRAARPCASTEIEHCCAGGRRVWIAWTSKAVRASDGAAAQVLCIGNDVTKRRSADEELQLAYQQLKKAQLGLIQAEKLSALGRFSAGIAHEVKNPLAIILGGTEYLEKRLEGCAEDVKTALHKIKESTFRADVIVQGLLRFARPSQLQVEKLSPNVLVEETVQLLKYRATLKNIEIKVESALEDTLIEVDRNQMIQVLFNLLINAVEAMPQGGKLTIRAYKTEVLDTAAQPSSCVIESQDTGLGISPENLTRLFEPFFTTKRDAKGTGLGLSMSKMIVEKHKGELLIESRPGAGTTVKVILPLVCAAPAGKIAKL